MGSIMRNMESLVEVGKAMNVEDHRKNNLYLQKSVKKDNTPGVRDKSEALDKFNV